MSTYLYGDRAPSNETFVTLSTSTNLDNERVLTGTANQITVTDGGAGSTVVLSLADPITLGQVIIDVTSTEALLVRKDSDGGDVFIVDTTNSWAIINSRLGISTTPLTRTGIYAKPTFVDSATNVYGCNISATVNDDNTAYYDFYGSVSVAEAKTITTRYCLFVDAPLGDGTVTNDYAVWVDGTSIISTGGNLEFRQAATISTTSGNLTLSPFGELIISSAATASRLAYFGASKELESTDLATWTTGTANQITVTDDGDGSITLSTPQDIGTSSSVQFDSLVLDGTGTEALLVRKDSDGGDVFIIDTTNSRAGIRTSPSFPLHLSISAADTDNYGGYFSLNQSLDSGAKYLVYSTAANSTTNVAGTNTINAGYFKSILSGTGKATGIIALKGQSAATGAGTITNLRGLDFLTNISNGVGATVTYMQGLYLSFDAEDAAVSTAAQIMMFMPYVDTGSINNSYGIYMYPPVIGAGSITNQYGIYIRDITGATTKNFAIYTGAGIVSLGANLEFRQASTISTTTGNMTIDPSGNLSIASNIVTIDGGTSGDAILYIDADTDNSNEADQPSIVWRQDGGAITASAGFFDSSDYFTIKGSHGNTDIVIETASFSNAIHIDNSQMGVCIGNTVAYASLHVDQGSSTGALPVLLLDQADIDIEFIKFIGSSEDGVADRSLVDVADMTTPGALVGWFQIYVEDIQGTNPITDGVYYVPFYAAPSA